MGHRLPFHQGKCINLHGHSYRMYVEVEGDLDENGMLIDFYDLKRIINPLVEELDHAFMVYKNDTDLITLLEKFPTKKVVVGFQSSVENISQYMCDKISGAGLPGNIKAVRVKVYETSDAYAEAEKVL